jgi:hypothetical protein
MTTLAQGAVQLLEHDTATRQTRLPGAGPQ